MSCLALEHRVGVHEVEMVLIYVSIRFDLQGGISPHEENYGERSEALQRRHRADVIAEKLK